MTDCKFFFPTGKYSKSNINSDPDACYKMMSLATSILYAYNILELLW